jgi:hypothetical protein
MKSTEEVGNKYIKEVNTEWTKPDTPFQDTEQLLSETTL